MAHRPPLTIEDKLLFSQVVHFYGVSDWNRISSELMDWSAKRGKTVLLTGPECNAIWTRLMQELAANDPTLKERASISQAPENLELVRRFYHLRLNELHTQILEKEMAFQTLSKEVEEIRRGEWDERLIPQKSPPEAAAKPTISSSSSQLSSIDSPVSAPVTETKRQKKAQEEEEKDEDAEGMEVDDPNETIKHQEESDATEDDAKHSPSALIDDSALTAEGSSEADAEDDQDIEETKQDEEGEKGDEQSGGDEEEEEPAEAPTGRDLRRRKAPTLELEIPTASTSRRGKGAKTQEASIRSSTRTRRRGGDSQKDPSSPMNESVAGTLETATTPAATDENASVIDDASSKGRRTRGHKRKASEVDGELPMSKSKREKSTTVDDEPMTPALPTPASGRPANPKLRPSMTQTMMLLNGEKYADIFRRPVTKKDAPDYAQAVLRPIDLGTIQKAIKAGTISSWEELERDLMRMLANCCVYNRPGTEAHETARQMLRVVEETLEAARDATRDAKP